MKPRMPLKRSPDRSPDRNRRPERPEELREVDGVVIAKGEGFGFLDIEPERKELHPEHNPLEPRVKEVSPESIFIPSELMRRLLHKDRIKALVGRVRGRLEVLEVLSLIHSPTDTIFGSLKAMPSGQWLFYPSGLYRNVRLRLEKAPASALNRLLNESGASKVLGRVRLSHHPLSTQEPPAAHLVEYFTPSIARSSAVERAIDSFQIRTDFSPECLKEAESATLSIPQELEPFYKDLRELPLITIDGEDSKDFDDAVYAEKENEGFRLVVAIADVSHYVKMRSVLDQEAFLRGNSFYFPGRTIPMLPEALSNGLCSLNPDVERLCMVCDMHLSSKGELDSFEFYPARMESKSRQTYHKVARFVENQARAADIDLPESVVPSLKALKEITDLRLKVKKARGALEMELPERKFVLSEEGRLTDVRVENRTFAHLMIEEAMILANVATAEFLDKHNPAFGIYRIHEPPTQERFLEFREQLQAFEAPSSIFPNAAPKVASEFTPVIHWLQEHAMPALLMTLLIRSLSRARYSERRADHFGLSLSHYTHFTSPIRRYADLLAHRLIKWYLGLPGFGELPREALKDGAFQASFMEQISSEAGYAVNDGLKCFYMKDFEGERFEATITSIRPFGVFVMLDNGFDGLISSHSLQDYNGESANNFSLGGGRTYQLGERVVVELAEVNFLKERLVFELLDGMQDEQDRPPRQKREGGREGGGSRGRRAPRRDRR